jgi:predicted phosphodiesterase
MKFKLLSDLHLEFYNADKFMWKPEVTDEDKDIVLLLAGDIHVGGKAEPWIREMCERFKTVVYILGNHEFYHREMNHIRDFWRDVEMPDNFIFLDDDMLILDNVRILGGTLWTHVADPFLIWQAKQAMADYQIIRIVDPLGRNQRMNVGDTNKLHAETLRCFRDDFEMGWAGQTIVMTHHLPHPKCVATRFIGNNLNNFFMTDLDDFIAEHDIDVWVHGHTHDNVDVEVHGTRILCNPMGYHGREMNKDFNEGLTFEL